MSFLRDLRVAVHSLTRTPGLAITVILTLSLGIGADQLRGIHRFKTLHRLRLTMTGLRGFIREDELVQESRWIILFLPC